MIRSDPWFELVGIEIPEKVWRATGCPLCYEQGYRGRVPILETWTVDWWEIDQTRHFATSLSWQAPTAVNQNLVDMQ